MKPLSQEAVKRLALSHGGRLELEGQRVNSARLQVVTAAPKPKEAPAYMQPEPKPEPPRTIEPQPDPAVREALLSIDNYAASQFLINESNARVIEVVRDMLAKAPPPQDKRPTTWVFKVKRDAQGLMETITATAKFKE